MVVLHIYAKSDRREWRSRFFFPSHETRVSFNLQDKTYMKGVSTTYDGT